jgi:hypothetical protein
MLQTIPDGATELVVGGLLVVIGKIVLDWVGNFRIGRFVSHEECSECQARCRAEIQKELKSGEDKFKGLEGKIDTLTSAVQTLAVQFARLAGRLAGESGHEKEE